MKGEIAGADVGAGRDCPYCWMYLGRHESKYWPYWWRLSAFSWYLSVPPHQSRVLFLVPLPPYRLD